MDRGSCKWEGGWLADPKVEEGVSEEADRVEQDESVLSMSRVDTSATFLASLLLKGRQWQLVLVVGWGNLALGKKYTSIECVLCHQTQLTRFLRNVLRGAHSPRCIRSSSRR